MTHPNWALLCRRGEILSLDKVRSLQFPDFRNLCSRGSHVSAAPHLIFKVKKDVS
jgi:hypothetical protein